jgi:hypothetical protein
MDKERRSPPSVAPRHSSVPGQQKRGHSKVAQQLPKELREAVDKRILAGMTYQEIADYINGMGHEISRSSVNRYGKAFLSRMEKLKLFQEQAKSIVEQAGDRPALEVVEATSQMAVQAIMEHVMQMDGLKGAKATEIFKSLALLERSAVAREKLKADTRRKAAEAVKNIEDKASALKNLDAETLNFIKEQIYGITG